MERIESLLGNILYKVAKNPAQDTILDMLTVLTKRGSQSTILAYMINHDFFCSYF